MLCTFAAAHTADRFFLFDAAFLAFADVPATAADFTKYTAACDDFTKTAQQLVACLVVTCNNLWQFALTSFCVR